jgi:hypothetical protein
MRTFTAVLPMRPSLPHDLALLLAPVRAAHPLEADPNVYVARADGALLDEDGRVVAFILRLARPIDARGQRTLVPITEVSLLQGPELRLKWTEDQLRAQPRLEDDLQVQEPTNEGGPPDHDGESVLKAAGETPPTPRVNKSEAAKEGIEAALIGGALGALAGLAIGGPIAIAGMAVFFATGGSMLGLVSGAEHKPAPPLSDTTFAPLDASDHDALAVWLGEMEARLRDPALEYASLVSKMQITLPAPTEAPLEEARAVSGWR